MIIEYDCEHDWYWIDIGEESNVNFKRCNVVRCDMPKMYLGRQRWKRSAQRYIQRQNKQRKFQKKKEILDQPPNKNQETMFPVKNVMTFGKI